MKESYQDIYSSMNHHVGVLSAVMPDSKETVYFTEEKVLGDGNCGFYTLGASREEVVENLLQLRNNENVRRELCDEIGDAFQSGELLPPEPNEWEQIFQDYTNKTDALNKKAVEIAKIINPQIGNMELQQYLQYIEKNGNNEQNEMIASYKLEADNAQEIVKLYCQKPNVFEHYASAYKGKLWLGWKSALMYGKQKNISIFVWRKENEKLELMGHCTGQEGGQIIHMLLTDRFTHFNLLVRTDLSENKKNSDYSLKFSQNHIQENIEFSNQNHQNDQVKIKPQHALNLLLEQAVRLRDKYENQKNTRQALNQFIQNIEIEIHNLEVDNNIRIESNVGAFEKFQLAIENNRYAFPEEVKCTLLLFIENEQASFQLQAVRSKQLNSEEILGFIKEGQTYAGKAHGENITIFIGNTGTGKSTLINAMEGCSMTWGHFNSKDNTVRYEEKSLFDLPQIKQLSPKVIRRMKNQVNDWDEKQDSVLGFLRQLEPHNINLTRDIIELAGLTIKNRISLDLDDKENEKKERSQTRRVILVDERGNNKKAVAGIGHKLEAFTFYPKIIQGKNITYADCPGFEDTRGEEIEIANAVNTLHTINHSISVKVVILINYYSFKDKRAQGLDDLWKILTKLFGNKANIFEHKDSILIMMSQVPEVHLDDLPNDLFGIRNFMKEKPELAPLNDRICICDPLDRRISHGCLSISDFRELVVSLKPIQNPESVFRTSVSKATAMKLVLFAKESKEEIMGDIRNGRLTDAYQKFNYLMQLTVLKDSGFDKEIEQLKVELKQVLRMLIENMLDIPKPEKGKGKEAYIGQLQQFQQQLSKALNFDRLLGGNLVKDAYFKSCCTLLRQLFKQPVFPKAAIEEQVQNLFALMNHFDRPKWQTQINTLIDEVYYKGNQVAVFGYNKRLAGKLFVKLNQYLTGQQQRRYGVVTVEDFRDFAQGLQIQPNVLFQSLVKAGWLALLDENNPNEAKITISHEALFGSNLQFPDTIKDPAQRKALVELMKNHLLIDVFFTKKFLTFKEGHNQNREVIVERILRITQNREVKEDNYKQHQITEILQECFDHQKAEHSLDCLKALSILNPEQVEKRYKLLDHTQRNFKHLNQSLTHDNPLVPTGSIFMLPTDQVPFGYKACNGEWLPVNTYFALYHVIKDSFGERDQEGQKQFRLPDYRGSFLRGNKDNRRYNDKQNDTTRMPRNNSFITLNSGSHDHTGNTSNAGDHKHVGSTIDQGGDHKHAGSTINQGGNHGHTGKINGSGSHSHTGNTNESGQHNHGLPGYEHALRDSKGSDTHSIDGINSGRKNEIFTQISGSHTHTVVIDKGGDHTHDLVINSGGDHTHGLVISDSGNHTHGLVINDSGDHTHGLVIQRSGDHSHVVKGGDDETRPENYPVNFVMKYN